MINDKELEIVKTQVSKAQTAANEIVVNDNESLLAAGELRKKIKVVGKMIKDKKDSIIKPFNEGLKNARALFAPLEDEYDEAEKTVARKMLNYQNEVEAERRRIEAEAARKQAEAQRKLEAEEISKKQADRIETREEKKIAAAPVVIKKADTFHTRTIKKFTIIDVDKLPREYMTPDSVKIREAMMAGVTVAGVEYFEEKVIV